MSRVVVFGSINLDLVTQVQTHPKPGETVTGSNYEMFAGGKGANQAYAASKNEYTEVVMVGAVGGDVFSDEALRNLKIQNINLDHVSILENSRTGVALIAIDVVGENTIVVTPGANHLVSAAQLSALSLNSKDILLTQNELQPAELFLAHELAREAGSTIVHNAAPAHLLEESELKNIDYLIVNESEAKKTADGFGLDQANFEHLAKYIYEICNTKLIVTLGKKGALLFLDYNQITEPAASVDVMDTTGAGDAFCGVFAGYLSVGNDPEVALVKAVDAGSQACEKLGAQN